MSYDRKKVEAMILTLIDLGHYHLADALRACKKESTRPGVLRILRADLKRMGRKARPRWVEIMAARRRKTLVLCHDCHRAIHAGRLAR